MATVDDFLAAARSMLSWGYLLGSHGKIVNGVPTVDCQGLVVLSAIDVGIEAQFGPVLPWEVQFMVGHWPGQVVPPGQQRAGDIVCFTLDGVWEHTGIATSASTYISALNPTEGVKETTIQDALNRGLVLTTVLRPRLTEDSMILLKGTITLLTKTKVPAASLAEVDPAIMLIDEFNQYVKPAVAQYPFFAYNADSPHGEPGYATLVNGRIAYVLARNGFVTLAV